MLIWDGSLGAIFNPGPEPWRQIADAPVQGAMAVSTGTGLLVAAGAAYDPATDSWRDLPPAPVPVADQVAAVWTGDALVVLGTTGSAVYRPATPTPDASPAAAATAVASPPAAHQCASGGLASSRRGR